MNRVTLERSAVRRRSNIPSRRFTKLVEPKRRGAFLRPEPPLQDALALAFERGDIRILGDPNLISELMAFQAETLPAGLVRYGAPSGHDDMVIVLALTWTAVSDQHRVIYKLPDNEIVVPEFPIPAHWVQAYGLDLRGNTAAGIWGARDPQSDVLYRYREYCAEGDLLLGHGSVRPGLVGNE